MLPQKVKIGTIIGILLLCSSGYFVTATNVFQEGPLTCYTCDSIEECALSKGTLKKCENNVAQTCWTVFNQMGAVEQRGCSDKAANNYASFCSANPERCPTCSSIGCNDGISLDQYVECLACDSSTDANCVLNPSAIKSKDFCLGQCMTALYPVSNLMDETESNQIKYHLVRSCLRDKDVDDREKCLNGEDARWCTACEGANCNVQKFPAESHSCHHCDGDEVDCAIPVSHQCVRFYENDQCFMQFDGFNDVIKMGCRSDFDRESEIIDLIKEKELWFCDGKDCNDFARNTENFPINSCLKCSTLSKNGCATDPTMITSTDCPLIPYTQCYERAIVENGATTRGCLNELVADEFYDCLIGADPNCRICNGEECNNKNIPEDRLQCLRCDSSLDSSCHTRPAGLSVCPKYDAHDSCVATYKNGVTKRGCLSEFTCDVNSKSCEICTGNGCNTENVKKRTEEIYGAFQTLPLNCNTCTGEECKNGKNNLHKCEGSLYQDCWTIFDEQGAVVRRGCEGLIESNYLTHCEEHPELCFNCKSTGCNNANDPKAYQECLYCDSAVDANCLFNPAAVTTKRRCFEGCLASLYPRKGNEKVFDLARACLEDMEFDDRDDCATKECRTCQAPAACNTNILPEETPRFSCNHCSGSDCDEPMAKECVGYTENDGCYMRFSNVSYSIIAMGCKSELTDAEILTEAKQFYICNEENCNDVKYLEDARICTVCDSATDVNCAVDVAKVTTKSRCQVNPYTSCYTRVRSDGHTERGCLYNLPTDNFLDCRDSKDPKCHVCSETNCNQNIFPVDRPQCYRCNSENSKDCEAAPTTAQACPIYNAEDCCTTKIMDGITYRGCNSELNCADAGRRTCRTCSDKNCNSINLIEEYIGDPGKFQTLPLNCYHCENSDSCDDTSSGKIRKCLGDVTQTCTTAFASNGSVISRGCSDLLEDICSIEGNHCYDCLSSGCNLATKESDYVDCLFCDAQESDKCTFEVASVTRTRKCHKSCMTALYPRTTDAHPVMELTRTCLDDMDLDDRVKCAADNHADCKVCVGEKCNTAELGERKSCYQCSNNVDCQSPTTAVCRAVVEQEQCYIQYDEVGEVVEMGCKSQYDPPDVDILLRAKRLWLCDDDNCNDIEKQPVPHRCTICSSRTDPQCATTPDSVEQSDECARIPFTQCYMRVLEGGHTERGCLSSLEGDQFLNCLYNVNATECLTCDEANCNQKVHPADRLSCNTCSSETTTACESNPQSAQVCLKYSTEQQCISELTQDGVTKRGCSLEMTCDPNSAGCEKCEGNNCNRSNLKRKSDGKPGQWQELPLMCHACNSEAECVVGRSTLMCHGEEYCMTVFNENDVVVARGCSDEIEAKHGDYCDINSGKCYNCNSNECNSATKLTDYVDCVYCDARTNPDCIFNVDTVQNRRKCQKACMTVLYPREENSTVWELQRTCLDDKDIPDQTHCQGNLCKSCTDAACNRDIMPADRRSCWSCAGDECIDPQMSLCKSYKEDDRCFLLFDDESDLVRMGCETDLSANDLTDNIHLLLFCDEGDNCNFFDKIPTPKKCAVCNSIDDPTCAANPVGVPAVDTCSNLPNTQCYTKVNRDGSTTRGCASSLPKTDMLACLSGDAADCTTCLGDRCNIEVFPADRRRCHRCNSVEDPLCESSSDATMACPFYSADEFCTVKYVNGRTYRGCSSEFQCDDSDKRYCRQCVDSDNCNYVDLASLDIGTPGKWQGVPINCYTCLGADCKGLIKKCENNNLQTCGVVFANNGSVVQRGCSDQIFDGEFLQQCDDGKCKFCKSSGCNNAESLKGYVNCLDCDSTDSSDCVLDIEGVRKTRSCHGKCMVGLYPRAGNDSNPILDLSRGCLDDLDLDDRLACDSNNKKHCKTCEGDSCNTAPVPEFRLRCYVCHDEASCKSVPQIQTCLGFRENDQCFTLFNESRIQRLGCASDLETPYMQTNRRQLLLCDRDNCNNLNNIPKSVSCSYCDSITDPKCVSNPSQSDRTVCQDLPYSQCFTRVDAAGTTIRGCLSDLPDASFDDCLSGKSATCDVCSNNNCNLDIYPAGRRSCNRCNSEDDRNCVSSANEYSSICPIYEETDTCVTAIDGGKILRGCASEFTCDANQRDKCRYCNADNCNIIDLLSGYIGEPGKWQGLPLNCYHCEGTDCASSNGQLRKCEGNNKQTCMTIFATDGSVSSRGCSDIVNENNVDYCEENPDKCIGCKSSGCNNVASLNQYEDCYFCDSTESKSCSINFVDSTRTRKCHSGCMVALYPRSSSDDPAYEMSRSCLDDLDEDDRKDCKNNEKEYCKACDGQRCNKEDIPDERHECYKCTDSECVSAVVQKCSAYHPKDQCYTLFDNTGSIAGMGCRSEFETEIATELVKQKVIRLCDGKNCNSFSSLPTPKLCSSCNSDLDPRCATNPNLVANTTRCASTPYTECSTHVNADGHTIRGCLSSLDSETFYSCLTNPNDKRCEICTGDKCNEIDIFPSNRLLCHQCSSASDASCGEKPSSNSVCPIYKEDDKCITNLRNGITTRGCSTTMKCDNADDRRTCRICSGSGCNIIDLARLSDDGEPGKWQPLPLTCYTCDNVADCEEVRRLRPCDGNKYQNCMTIFNAEGKVEQRGCSDKLEAKEEYCENNTGKCPRCNSNGCNMAQSLNDYVECVSCDTDVDGNCVRDVNAITKTRRCYKQCMTALYAREEEDNPAYGLSRSCLDDMDQNDREACATDDKANCKACAEGKCNIDEIPNERLSCNHCQGDDCQAPKAQKCINYRQGDKCYIQFDEKSSAIAMGCRSEFTNSEANFLLKEKRLFMCDGENCNTMDALPAAQYCALCNSRTDVNCATAPQNLGGTNCAVQPYTQCYSRVLPDGITERGCLSNLQDDEFLSCLNGTSSTCKMCGERLCNREIYPEDRASCHICDSSVDRSCEASPANLTICPKYSKDETCVTQFRNDVTYRGCSSSLSCDLSNPKTCRKCSGNGCNVINLARKQDDNFGKWQDLPLSCWTCKDDACKTTETNELQTCANNNKQDCVVVFDASDNVIRRGCSDEVEAVYEDYCDENEGYCYNCKSNKCNSVNNRDNFVECVYCDSYKDLNCVWNPNSTTHWKRHCAGGCMTALYPSDGSSNPSYDLVRTCLSDKEEADQTTCGKDGNCRACKDSDSCNVKDLPEDRWTCYSCKGEDCDDPAVRQCPLYKKDDKCFIWFDEQNSVSEMGCISSFRNQELESILKTKRVYVCNERDCNNFDELASAQKCAVCDSNDNVNCATDAVEVGTFKTCSQQPYTSCYSKLAKDGSTLRGCLSDLPANEFVDCLLNKTDTCGMCLGDGCNREIFPADRLQCYSCSTEDDASCESFPSRQRACPLVTDTESCTSSFANNITERGCSSQLSCDPTDRSACRLCKGTSCNTIDLRNIVDDGYHGIWQTLPLRCHTCEGDHCKTSLGPALTCHQDYEEDCMTVFDKNGDVKRRGCSDDVETYEDQYCRQNPEHCFKCKSNECNVAWELNEYVSCAFCNSSSNAVCVTDPEYAEFGKRSCYKECLVAIKDGVLVRSCLDDKELLVQHICRADESGTECATCDSANCNQFNYPENRRKCHVCIGSQCATSRAEYCVNYVEDDYCFAKFENGRADVIGCASSQNASDIEQWKKEKKFYACEGNECNELTKLPKSGECIMCDSSKTLGCAQDPTNVATTEMCSAPRGECLTRIDEGKNTLRSCANRLTDEQEAACVGAGTCAICSGSKCNSEVFPITRRKCYICNSVADKDCDKSGQNALICPHYDPADTCVAYKDEEGFIKRGCGSDFTCNASEPNCKICSENLCNKDDLSGAAGLIASSLTLTLVLAFIAVFTLNN